jgi:hypothetical protein
MLGGGVGGLWWGISVGRMGGLGGKAVIVSRALGGRIPMRMGWVDVWMRLRGCKCRLGLRMLLMRCSCRVESGSLALHDSLRLTVVADLHPRQMAL